MHILLLVWVYNSTNHSLLAAVPFHEMMNFTGDVLGPAPELFPFTLTGNLPAATAVIVGSRPRWQKPPPAPAPNVRQASPHASGSARTQEPQTTPENAALSHRNGSKR